MMPVVACTYLDAGQPPRVVATPCADAPAVREASDAARRAFLAGAPVYQERRTREAWGVRITLTVGRRRLVIEEGFHPLPES
jgi:hypothetical protein